MKNTLLLCAAFVAFFISSANGQFLEALDFTKTDCDTNEHHLFSELDEGKVILLEFTMGCVSCNVFRTAIEDMEIDLEQSYPGRFHIYTIAYRNSITCKTMKAWNEVKNFTDSYFSGLANHCEHYGGCFGMPTVVILGGQDHKVLYSRTTGFPEDTLAAELPKMKAAIQAALATASVPKVSSMQAVRILPNPSSVKTTITVTSEVEQPVQITLFNALGARVKTVSSGSLAVGSNDFDLITASLPNGTYYLQVAREGGEPQVVPLIVSH